MFIKIVGWIILVECLIAMTIIVVALICKILEK